MRPVPPKNRLESQAFNSAGVMKFGATIVLTGNIVPPAVGSKSGLEVKDDQ